MKKKNAKKSKRPKVMKMRVVEATCHEGLSLRAVKNRKLHGVHDLLGKAGFKAGDEVFLTDKRPV